MKFKKVSKGLWGSDDVFFGAVLLHDPGDKNKNKYRYRVFFLIKDENDGLDSEDAVWSEKLMANTQKKAIEAAEKEYSIFLSDFIKAAQLAKKKK